ncbi:MAG: hypothetical protein CMP81_21930, partial [Fulvimarina sp.]|nr:hypothetical protein [Fulvimarina sp.]
SGALIFNSDRQVVGIHHTGGLNENDPSSFNEGSNIADVLGRSALLKAAPASSGAPAPVPPVVAATPQAPDAAAAGPASTVQPTPQPAGGLQPAPATSPNAIIGGSDPASTYNELLLGR